MDPQQLYQLVINRLLGQAQTRPDLLSANAGGPSFGSPDYRAPGNQRTKNPILPGAMRWFRRPHFYFVNLDYAQSEITTWFPSGSLMRIWFAPSTEET